MGTLAPEKIELSGTSIDDLIKSSLIVLNDNVNTFEHVIRCLIRYCNHTAEQAEQCAYIIHYNGKCSVKNGTKEELKPIKDALIDQGLSAIIQN